jgi:hypothetical protein
MSEHIQPLPGLQAWTPHQTTQSATAFQMYLETFHLDPVSVALTSGVRYVTIWNLQHGIPVSKEHATGVCQGLFRLTGVVYAAPIATRLEQVPGCLRHELRTAFPRSGCLENKDHPWEDPDLPEKMRKPLPRCSILRVGGESLSFERGFS